MWPEKREQVTASRRCGSDGGAPWNGV